MPTLRQQYDSLNKYQKEAVDSVVFENRNTLVVAGPGSGKTRMLSTAASMLYARGVPIVCLSLSKYASNEIRKQINKCDIYESRELEIGTVHDFCLKHLIYPFIHVYPDDFLTKFSIASTLQTKAIERNVKPDSVSDDRTITVIRRQLMAEGQESITDSEMEFLEKYDFELKERKLIDFDIIVQKAIELISNSELVRRYLESHFKWIFIDEYQDMGGSLHKLVMLLLEKTTIKFLAVGDPDQLIFGFLGAKRIYMEELFRANFSFRGIKICYRFGNELVLATGKLRDNDEKLKFEAAENKDGHIHYLYIPGHANQIRYIIEELLPYLTKEKHCKALNDIAILYRYTIYGDYEAIHKAFLDDTINVKQYPVYKEKNSFANLDDSPFIEWLRGCAGWRLTGKASAVNELLNYVQFYSTLLTETGILLSDEDIADLRLEFIRKVESVNRQATIGTWLLEFDKIFNVRNILLQSGTHSGSVVEFDELLKPEYANLPIDEFLVDKDASGVTLTTIHSSKGREFDYVILPKVESGVYPNPTHDDMRNAESVAALRRLLYVACTRAKYNVYILGSQSPRNLPIFIEDIPNLKMEL